ncbi:MAG: OsmC family protein [Herpetosiphon sp.]
MAGIERTADAGWTGDLQSGKGHMSTHSGILKDAAFTFATRFEQAPGTNPEELVAAAHAACFSMNLSATLAKKGHQPQSVETHAICTLQGGKITKMRLQSKARVHGIDEATFQQIAHEAEQTCPISNLYRNNAQIELDAKLEHA